MNPPRLVSLLLLAAGLLLGSVPAAAAAPNIVLILVDDMGWSDLGCYGSEIDTPNLDRLAAGGLRFTQFYNTAKCAQTRATLLSGLNHDEVGIARMRNCWTLAEAMKKAGYFTLMAGKWHLAKEPTDRGFDRYFGHLSGATDYFKGNNTFRLNGKPFKVPAKGFYTTDAFTDYAIRFIDESRASGKPFFCYLAYNAPHYPLQAPRKEVEKYRGKYQVGWDQLRKQRYARQQQLGLLKAGWKLSPRPADVPAWATLSPDRKDKEDLRMATYAGMIDRLDQDIGKLVAHLKKQGVFEDTLLMFLSDNGACPFDRNRNIDKMPWEGGSHWTYDKGWAHACNTPFREYKRNQHEGGISTPCIVHWPGGLRARPGSITHQVGHLVDVMPTLLELTGTKYPDQFHGEILKPLRGRSLLPILAGQMTVEHKALYFDFAGVHHAIRMGKWKLVAKDRGPWELYDMEADRSELNDLAKSQPDRVKAMQQAWEAWAREVGVKERKRKK
jgi:arylsulfatase A-like enzyme